MWAIVGFFLRFFFFWCGPFLKSLLNLLQYCFCFMFWFFGREACEILAPRPGIEPAPSTLEGKVLTTGPPWKSRGPLFIQCLLCVQVLFLFFFFFRNSRSYLLIDWLLWWVFVSVRGPPPVAASGDHSSSRRAGLSPSRPLSPRSTGSRRAGSVICGSRAQLLRGMRDPPRPGLEPAYPALAGRLPTTAPPGKPRSFSKCLIY